MERRRVVRDIAMLVVAVGGLAATGVKLFEQGQTPPIKPLPMNVVAKVQKLNEGTWYCIYPPGHSSDMAAYQQCYDRINNLPVTRAVPTSKIEYFYSGSLYNQSGDEPSPNFFMDFSDGYATNTDIASVAIQSPPTKSLFEFVPVLGS